MVAPSDGPVIYLITGPMAAGKTTVARLLATRFDRGVHLEGDFFRRSIIHGREEMTPELSPAALDQLRLHYRLPRPPPIPTSRQDSAWRWRTWWPALCSATTV